MKKIVLPLSTRESPKATQPAKRFPFFLKAWDKLPQEKGQNFLLVHSTLNLCDQGEKIIEYSIINVQTKKQTFLSMKK